MAEADPVLANEVHNIINNSNALFDDATDDETI